MGSSPAGKLIYGYSLGNSEDGYNIQEIDKDGNWTTAWAIAQARDPDRDHEDPDPIDQIEDILRTAGLEIGTNKPLQLIGHGHIDYGYSHALVTYEAEAEWSEVTAVDLAALDAMRTSQGWDTLLAQAIEVLGITPITRTGTDRWDTDAPRVPVPPRWMVVAEYI